MGNRENEKSELLYIAHSRARFRMSQMAQFVLPVNTNQAIQTNTGTRVFEENVNSA